jgi:GNAT superfamily N-acetyltransferase
MPPSEPASIPLTLRPAQLTDLDTIVGFIRELAEYEQRIHLLIGNPEDLARHLFGDRPYAEALIAEWQGSPAGYALWFFSYSTFRMQPSLYLEDVYVAPPFRRRGIAKRILQHLARLALEQGCGRFEWSVLEWNRSAIAFYQSLGAQILPDWRICRVVDHPLHCLAQQSENGSTS